MTKNEFWKEFKQQSMEFYVTISFTLILLLMIILGLIRK